MIKKLDCETDKNLLPSWVKINSIDRNNTKTKVVVFEKKTLNILSTKVKDHKNYCCESYKFLGIQFDKVYDFEVYIITVTDITINKLKRARHRDIFSKLGETHNRIN